MQSLVFLHGALGAASQWAPVHALLKDHFHVSGFNFSGHGGQPFSDRFSIESFREELKLFLDDNDIQQPVLIGYSMGGYVALSFACSYPERVHRMLTLGTKFDWSPETAQREVKMLDADRILEKVPAFAAELQALHAPNDWRLLLQKTAALMLALGQHSEGWIDDFSTIQAPVRLLLGETDRMVTQEETNGVRVKLPNATFSLLPGMPHALTQTDSALLAAIIRSVAG